MNYKKMISDRMPGKPGAAGPGTMLLTLAGGIVLGSVAALLFAPASGEKTREKLRKGARELANGAKGKLEAARHKLRTGNAQRNMSDQYAYAEI